MRAKTSSKTQTSPAAPKKARKIEKFTGPDDDPNNTGDSPLTARRI